MIFTNLLLLPALAGTPSIEWKAPSSFVRGAPYTVAIEITCPDGESSMQGWAITPAAFLVNDKPLATREDGPLLTFPAGSSISMKLDLASYLAKAPGLDGGAFKLEYAQDYSQGEPIKVTNLTAAPTGLDFMTMPESELSNYLVLLSTNRGDMIAEFWPDVAPNHVRNFLDLSYTEFYDSTVFHRVIPGFMIQGGDPTGTGTGSGKRQLDAEFNDRKHVPGVLSMARSQSPDSASCQFFVMHANSSHLDGQYSAFGQLQSGIETVEAIVNSPRDGRDKPLEKQVIKKATVLLKPQG